MIPDDFLQQELEQIPLPELLEIIQDDEQVLSPQSLYALSDLMPSELRSFQEVWTNISAPRRRAILEDLEYLTESNNLLSYEAVFRYTLSDPDAQVRFYALRAIEVFDTHDLIPVFLKILDEDDNEDVRAVAAAVLGKYIYQGELDEIDQTTQTLIEQRLLAVIAEEEPLRVQYSALEALGYSPLNEVKVCITEAYQSGSDEWLTSALFAMGRSLDNHWDKMVISKLYHQNPKVRTEAIRAAGELNIEDALPAVLEMLDDIPIVRQAAIWAASQIEGEGAEAALNALLDEPLTDTEFDIIERALQNLDFLDGGL